MFKKIFIAIAAVVAVFLVYVALQPADYMVSREITINAPAAKIFPYLNNQKLAEKWEPWSEIDPAAKMTYSGADAGVGARADWTGGKQLGTGSATIIESVPEQRVAIKLEYTAPMQATQDAEYLIKSSGNQSVVVWTVRGKNTFPARIMCFFMNMDKMVGGMFEKGLANLKVLTEKS